jgi:ELWxxDGT repeat protein
VPLTETNAAFAGTVVDLAAVNGTLFFATSGELWRTDGTMAGTTRAVDIIPGPEGAFPSSLVSAGNTLFFAASDATGGSELWRSDGTAAGTLRVQEIIPGPAGGNPRDLAAAGDYLFLRPTMAIMGASCGQWA